MTDLDQLLRDTLQGRAATITDAPPVPDAAEHRRDRSRWLLVAVTVAAVVVAGGGAAVWGLSHGRSSQQSGGGYARTCPAKLPAAWKLAFAGPGVGIDGDSTTVVAITAFGDVVSWTTGALGIAHVGLRLPSGGTRTLFTGQADQSVSTSVDGTDLVLSVTPVGSGQGLGPNVRDIVAIDLRTSKVEHLLPSSGMPRDTAVGDRTAVVLDGIVYWTAVPRGTHGGPGTTVVLAYDLRRHRASVVAKSSELTSTEDDAAGVFWNGGGVRRPKLPIAVPSDGPAVSDGARYAWPTTSDLHEIGWADAAGNERVWHVVSVYDGMPVMPIAVTGPFVYLFPIEHHRPHLFVMDTRTGAVVDSGRYATGAGAGREMHVALGVRMDDQSPFRALLLDTAHLPELRCR